MKVVNLSPFHLEEFISVFAINNKRKSEDAINQDIDAYLTDLVDALSDNPSIAEIEQEEQRMREEYEQENKDKSSGTPAWYYHKATIDRYGQYTKYPKLKDGSTVITGDLMHDDAGGSGLTGHSGIVMGRFYHNIYGYYIRVCEAVKGGVSYGILSDERASNRKTSVHRVSGGANATKRSNAASWAASQNGEKYRIPVLENFRTTNISKSRQDGYCSLVVYAAYKAQGVNLGDQTGNTLIHPNDLKNSTKTAQTFRY